MKTFASTILLVLALNVKAYASINCGLKPLPPLGCSSAGAMCVCYEDSGSECQWIFTNCR